MAKVNLIRSIKVAEANNRVRILFPQLRAVLFLTFLFLSGAGARAQYRVHYEPDSIRRQFNLRQDFPTRQVSMAYVSKIPDLLAAKGYPFASVDSTAFDSSAAYCLIYAGDPLRHTILRTDSIEPAVLEGIGWNRIAKKIITHTQFPDIQEKIMAYMENNGYPFARVGLEKIDLQNDTLYAALTIEKGPLYKIDSIRNLGGGSISSRFLQQYLGIKNGSIYRREKLQDVSRRIRELPYLQEKSPWNLTMLGTGSILNVYLDDKKSSEVNVLVGLLPANDQTVNNKMLITGEALINLKNELGGGETIGLNWQQIQVKSPRLHLVFQQPYLFGSAFGLDFNFDLLKKDSSYVNIHLQLGAAYALSARQSGTVFLQRLSTNLLTVDTLSVKSSRKLPSVADVSAVNVGVNYDWNTTDYRYNPRSGNELFLSAAAGTRTIRKNNVIVKLFDAREPDFNFNSLYDTLQLNSYQFTVKTRAAHYFPVGRIGTIKAGLQGGWFQSPNLFRNELFQIGGHKTLRGFDEESIFSSAYGIATAEYRYLLGQHSFLSAFVDYALSANQMKEVRQTNQFLGLGLGMAFETKAGIFNLSYAVGKRDDASFNLRQSKIHLGYVNYF